MSRASIKECGFSLVESLVALGVFATACLGLFGVQTGSTRALATVETRTLAGIVAQNTLVAFAVAPDGLQPGQETVSLAERQWRVTTEVSPTPEASMRRVRVVVRETTDGPVRADVTAFLSSSGSAP
jgi:type II secretion system protein I